MFVVESTGMEIDDTEEIAANSEDYMSTFETLEVDIKLSAKDALAWLDSVSDPSYLQDDRCANKLRI